MCLIGNTELFCKQSKGIGLHLMAWQKSHGFSRVASVTCGTFSSYSGVGHSKLEFVQRSQDLSLVTTDTSGI